MDCWPAIFWPVRSVPPAGKGSAGTDVPFRIRGWPRSGGRWSIVAWPRAQAAHRPVLRRQQTAGAEPVRRGVPEVQRGARNTMARSAWWRDARDNGTTAALELGRSAMAIVTPQVLGLQLTLALHEPKHHLFIYEHGTYVMH
jgi:hypothetical protein